MIDIGVKAKVSYEVKRVKKNNYLLFMDDLNPFAKNGDYMDSLVNTTRTFQGTSEWSLGYQSVAALTIKRGKAVKR